MKLKNYILAVMGILSPFMMYSAEYYIKPGEGITGNDGSSWDSAITLDEFFEVYKGGEVFASGDTFYFAGGIYYPTKIADGDSEMLKLGFNFIGGFDPANTGTVSDLPQYPSATPTIFSGDLNKNGKPDTGDAGRLLLIRTNYLDDDGDKTPFLVQGIDFTCAYGLATNYNAGALFARRTDIVVKNCNFYNNESRDYGGAGSLMYGSKCHFIDCSFYNNKAQQTGAALRFATNSNYIAYAIVERCAVYDNEVTGNYAGGIANSSSSHFWLINSTVVNNKALAGGAGIVTNASSPDKDDIRRTYIISSTVAGNECFTDIAEGSAMGTQLRLAQPTYANITNSIIVGKTDNGTYSNSAIALTGNESNIFEFVSGGYNITGSFGIAAENSANIPNWLSSDTSSPENIYDKIFGTNTIANNGGSTKTLALKEHIEGAWVDEIETILYDWGVLDEIQGKIDWSVDQRGFKRYDEGPSIGAMDMMTKDDISVTEITQDPLNITLIGKGVYEVTSEINSIIEVYNINGTIVKSIKENSIIDLRDLIPGVYVAKMAGTSFKLIN